MKMEIETTIRTLAISDGIPIERVDAGLAAMKGVEGSASEWLFLNELARHPQIRMHPTMLWRLGVKSVSESFGGRPRYQLVRVVEYLRSPEAAAVREELRRKRRMLKGGIHTE